jgi:hypothetical protein
MIKGINHITLAIKDVEKSFEFYKDILGLKPVAKWNNGAYLTAGDTWIALIQDSKVLEAKRLDYSHIAFNLCVAKREIQSCAECGEYPCMDIEKIHEFNPQAKEEIEKIIKLKKR